MSKVLASLPGNGYTRLRHGTSKHNSLSDGLANWQNNGTVGKYDYFQTLNGGIRRKALESNYSKFRITYMEQKSLLEL